MEAGLAKSNGLPDNSKSGSPAPDSSEITAADRRRKTFINGTTTIPPSDTLFLLQGPVPGHDNNSRTLDQRRGNRGLINES